MAETYHIRVRGHLDAAWASWFEELAVTNERGGEALLAGPIVDQAALHGILVRIRDLGLPLLSVNRVPAPRPCLPDPNPMPPRSVAASDPRSEETGRPDTPARRSAAPRGVRT
jgi:hypothetical protein